jgi:hypothetical protein
MGACRSLHHYILFRQAKALVELRGVWEQKGVAQPKERSRGAQERNGPVGEGVREADLGLD